MILSVSSIMMARFLFAKNLILGDLIGNEAADLKTQVCDHEI